MRILKCFVFTIALTALLSLASAAQAQSLFERLGGKDSITAVVDEFAGRVLADTRINAKFAKSDPVRLKAMLVEQICEATGGPCKYSGRTMPASHAGMGVTAGEFNALVEDLVGALDKFNVPQKEKDELIGALAPMKAQIVEVESNATGTPLPKKYKPYSAAAAGKGGKGKGKKMKEEKPPKEDKKAAKEDKKMKEEAPKEEKMKEDKKSKKKN
jgi:hemoglobin